MSYFQRSGDAFIPTAGKESLLDELPVGNFVVAQSLTGLFYQKVPAFTPAGKLYGDTDKRADRILATFLARERATGVLLEGEKGSGKSLLARQVSLKGYEQNIPTILVNAPWVGDQFSSLLADVESPAIVLMDEFEKVYNKEQQEGVLTLLDGMMTTKKLFILTVNNKWAVDENMRNRPGRLFYSLSFTGLESSFVREYCGDNLLPELHEHIEMLVKLTAIYEKFNFDMLKAIVEEMNRYKEDPFETLNWVNAKPVSTEYGVVYDVTVFNQKGEQATTTPSNETPFSTDRGRGGGVVGIGADWDNVLGPVGDEDDDDRADRLGEDYNGYIIVQKNHVKKMDAEKGEFEFLTESGHRVIFKKQQTPAQDLRTLMY